MGRVAVGFRNFPLFVLISSFPDFLLSLLFLFPFSFLLLSYAYGKEKPSKGSQVKESPEVLCENGVAQKCYELGEKYENERNYKDAIYYYDSACIFGNAKACLKLSVVFARGLWGIEVNAESIRKSFFYTEKAVSYLGGDEKFQEALCDMGYASGCLNLALKLERAYNMKDKAEPLYKKAFELSKKECDSGTDGTGCMLLGFMFVEAVGVKKDVKQGIKYYERGCELNHGPSCSSLAEFYKNGDFLPKDEKKWKELMKKACSLFDLQACYSLWKQLSDKKYLERACYLGHAQACKELNPTQ